MRIAFVANDYLDPRKPQSWSGLPYFMKRALERAGAEVETFVVSEPNPVPGLFRRAYWSLFRRKRYLQASDSALLKRYAAEVEGWLRTARVDAVFCPSSWLVAYLETRLPIVFWSDASFSGMVDFYESFSNLAPCSLADGHAAEYAALKNCTRAIYSTSWAADSARSAYSADTSKIRVVPFGGNVVEKPSLELVESMVARRNMRECNLLLIGVDWERKGAEIAVETAKCLNDRGLPARLTIVGCVPPKGTVVPPYVEVIPFINKTTAEGRLRFDEVCSRSHFLMMPSRAEAYGLAIVEGNYYGLPCLAADVGGISSVVTDEVNGRLFDVRARGITYADYIIGLMRDEPRYRSLALGSASYADRQFSWDSAGQRVVALIREALAAAPGQPEGVQGASPSAGVAWETIP